MGKHMHQSVCQRYERQLPFVAALTLCLTIAGCGGPPIEADMDGRNPGDVVLAAYEAAIAGDFDKANSFGTRNFVAHEQRMRKAIEDGEISADTPSAAWTNRVAGISDLTTLKIEDVRWSKGFQNVVIVTLATPKGNAELELIASNNRWKLSSGEDRVK